MATPLIGEELKQIENLHRGSLNHWIVGLMHITVQSFYGLQYPNINISGYMNVPEEPVLLAILHGI